MELGADDGDKDWLECKKRMQGDWDILFCGGTDKTPTEGA